MPAPPGATAATSLQHPRIAERVESRVERVVFRSADNDVVDEVDPDDFCGLAELAGELDVGRTRCGVPAGVVVRNDNRCGRCENRDFEHLPRMRERARERPERDHRAADGFLLPVETDHPKAFLAGIFGVTVA